MGYPVGPLLRTLASRILANLDLIERQAPPFGSPTQDDPPYSDTQLLISLLGVLVFPHERAPDALGGLLRGHQELSKVVTVRHPKHKQRVDIFVDGKAETIDPASLQDLPRLLRNSIAHFNIRPLNKNGRFGGIRVWNETDEGRITLIADIDFDGLRSLAKEILRSLAERDDLALDDPPDPLEMLQQKANVRPPKAPRISDSIWSKLLEANEGNWDQARKAMDRTLVASFKGASRR